MKYRNLILAFAVVLLLLPVFIRAVNNNPLVAGEESYYHIRMADLISEGKTKDPLLLNRPVPLTPYNVLLGATKKIIPYPFASLILSFVLGLLSLWLLLVCLEYYGIRSGLFVMGVFVLSPLFVSVFSQATPFSLLLFAFIATLFTAARQGKIWSFLTYLLVILQAVSSPPGALFGVLAPFATSRVFPKFRKRAGIAAALGAFSFLLVTLPRWFRFEAVRTVPRQFAWELVADFGNKFGLSIFALLLAILGFVIAWKHKKKFYFLYSIAILTILLGSFLAEANIYAAVVVSLFAGIAYFTLAKMKWKLYEIKLLTLFVIFCGLLFSTVAVTVQTSLGSPTEAYEEAGMWLADQPQGTVLSHQKNGYWLGFFAGQPLVLDAAIEQTPEAAKRLVELKQLFATTDFEMAQKILNRYDVRYVVVTDEMRQGLVWEKQEQGFLFLLENSETFKKRFYTENVEVWEYRP